MGRPIKFNLSGVSLEAEITKVDRSKLYGTSARVVYDENGEECSLSNLYQGSAILPKGSISQTLLDSKGNYVSRSDLIGFNNLNQKVEKVSSIYSGENNCKKVTIDEFISANVKSIYQLNIENSNLENWKKCFLNDEIYCFIFNYREDYEGDDAFLISNGETAFAVIGKIADLEFVGMNDNEKELVVNEEESSEEDELDFAMF